MPVRVRSHLERHQPVLLLEGSDIIAGDLSALVTDTSDSDAGINLTLLKATTGRTQLKCSGI